MASKRDDTQGNCFRIVARLWIVLYFLMDVGESRPHTANTSTPSVFTQNLQDLGIGSITPPYNDSTASNCNIDATPEAVNKFQMVMAAGVDIVYAHVSVKNMTNIFDDSRDMFDPGTFVWALEGKGRLLLSFTLDYLQLSLWTLNHGVAHLDLDVDLPADHCYYKALDVQRQRIFVSYVGALARSANESLQDNTELYSRKESYICIGRIGKNVGENIFLDFLGLAGSNTLYSCWTVPQNNIYATAHFEVAQRYGLIISILGCIIALFCPLAPLLIIRKTTPHFEQSRGNDPSKNTFLAVDTELPVGFKYTLLYSYWEKNWAIVLRGIITIFAFLFVVWIRTLVFFLTNTRGTESQYVVSPTGSIWQLADSAQFPWIPVVGSGLLVVSFLILLLKYIHDPSVTDKYIKIVLRVRENDLAHLDNICFGLVKLDSPLNLPKYTNRPFHDFLMKILFKTLLAVDPGFWKTGHDFGGPKFLRKPKLYLLLFGHCLFHSIPLVYVIFIFPTELILSKIRKSCKRKKMPSLKKFFILGFFHTTVICVICIISVSAYVLLVEITEMLAYTFIGILLNYDAVGQRFIGLCVLVLYVANINATFYNSYRRLLIDLFKAAKNCGQDVEDSAQFITKDGQALVSLRLFEETVWKYKPIHREVLRAILTFMFMILVLWFAVATLHTVAGLSDLPAIGYFVLIFVVARLVPLLKSCHRSQEKQECQEMAKENNLIAFLKQKLEEMGKVEVSDENAAVLEPPQEPYSDSAMEMQEMRNCPIGGPMIGSDEDEPKKDQDKIGNDDKSFYTIHFEKEKEKEEKEEKEKEKELEEKEKAEKEEKEEKEEEDEDTSSDSENTQFLSNH